MKKVVSIYVDPEAYMEMKQLCRDRLGVSVSQKLDELIRQWVEEATGKEFKEAVREDYGAMKQQHIKMVKELDRLERHLKKKKVLDDLVGMVQKLGLDTGTFNNLDEVALKLLDAWTRLEHSSEDAHIFISYLELARDKKQLEQQLGELRRGLSS